MRQQTRNPGSTLRVALVLLALAACSSDPPEVTHDRANAGEGDGDGAEAADASVVLAGNDCVRGGRYCGGDKVGGEAKTLYRCEGSGAPSVIEVCANGCSVNPGVDDACATAPGEHVDAPVPGKSVTYPYGEKNARYAAGFHTGDDYATPVGSDAIAVRSGTIRWSNDDGGAYGTWIGLDADNGRTYVYCHLSKRLVGAGATVTAGELLAKTGATGNVTGPHLHFEDHPQGPFKYGDVREPVW